MALQKQYTQPIALLEIQKNAYNKFIVNAFSKWDNENLNYIGIRNWYKPNDESPWLPTKKGITIIDKNIPAIIKVMTDYCNRRNIPL